MQEILIRAGCFVAIIILGYVLRRIQFFKEEDFKALSKIALKITMPAAIITSCAGKEIDPAMLSLALIGFGAGLIYMGLGFLMNRYRGREQKAFGLLNLSGYNISNFSMPFIQNFLGPMGMIATSVFDVGNAFICLGGAYGVAGLVKDNKGGSVKKILKALVKSLAFDCYIIAILMCLLHISLPSALATFAQMIGNANAFICMLMIGVGFKLSGDAKQKGTIVKFLAVRYGVAVFVALGCYSLLPFSLEVRQALVILCFSPIASAVPPFTKDLGGDVGLSSALNSISIVCSIIFMVALLLVM